jgi:hypothetical protein
MPAADPERPTPAPAPRGPDRRRRPTRPWDVFFHPARRRGYRREGDETRHPIVDRHGPRLFIAILALLMLTLLDGLLTLVLIDSHRDEANPVMARLIAHHGAFGFVLGKYALTAACVPPLVIWKSRRLFGTPLRVKHLVPVFVGLYLLLTTCQFWVITSPHGPQRVVAGLAADGYAGPPLRH